MNDNEFLKHAVDMARKSVDLGGFPDGALVVKNGEVIAEGLSLGFSQSDPTGHAESYAIRDACKKLSTVDLSSCVLYASLQPCLMCFSATTWASIPKIVYGCHKTADMIDKRYYEGASNLSEVNMLNTHKIELIYISDFEEEMIELIYDWETKKDH